MFGLWLIVFGIIIRVESDTFRDLDLDVFEQTSANQLPFLGILIREDWETSRFQSRCTVSLLDSKIAITSATCFCILGEMGSPKDAYFVYLGFERGSAFFPRLKIRVQSIDLRGLDPCNIFPLPEDEEHFKTIDLAVLKLSEKVTPSFDVNFIELAETEDSSEVFTHATFEEFYPGGRIRLYKAEARQLFIDKDKTFFVGNISMEREPNKKYLNHLGDPAIVLKDNRYVLLGFVTRPMTLTEGPNKSSNDKLSNKFQYTKIDGENYYVKGKFSFFGKALKRPTITSKIVYKTAKLFGKDKNKPDNSRR